MSGIDPAEVTKALESEGLAFEANETSRVWSMTFEINAREQQALLSAPFSSPDESVNTQYLVAMSPIVSDRLKTPLEMLSTATLRTLMRAQAEVLLAKVDYLNSDSGDIIYFAMSPCSIVNVDGPKLRRRLEACADLASRIRAALLEPEEG
jgi:hypothetical protein